MTYYLYDSNGYVGDVCSNNGLNELQYSMSGKPFDKLWDKGWHYLTEDFLEAVDKLPGSDRTVKNFKSLVKKSKDIVIITDGVFEEGD